MSRYLVTGVGGFIASKVAQRLLAQGHSVVGVDDFSMGFRDAVPQGTELIEADLAEVGVLSRLPTDIDYVFHLAGQSSGEISFLDPVEDLQKNTISTLHLIQHAIKSKVERLAYASSMSVYGDLGGKTCEETDPCKPLSCYGVGKLAAEGYLDVYSEQLPFTSLRMSNVYGPGQNLANLKQGMVSIYLAQALSGDASVHVKGSLERFRDFIYVEDVVDVWLHTGTLSGTENYTLNVGAGTKTTVEQLLCALQTHIPEMTWYVEGATAGDQFGVSFDVTKLRDVMGSYQFTTLEEGLGTFVTWARQQY